MKSGPKRASESSGLAIAQPEILNTVVDGVSGVLFSEGTKRAAGRHGVWFHQDVARQGLIESSSSINAKWQGLGGQQADLDRQRSVVPILCS
jgi:hypothetical protein